MRFALPFLWSFEAEIPEVPRQDQWVWPVTARQRGAFEIRVRGSNASTIVEFGHKETGVPYEEE